MNGIIKYPRAKPYFPNKKEILEKIENILISGMLAQGKYVEEFENEFADMVGTKYAIATNSCTSALEMTIKALMIRNKKILVPTQTFVATINSVLLSGNTPVILDIDESMNISADQIIKHLKNDSEIEAIIWVHMAGLISPRFKEVKELCDEKGIYIIEDAAHAHGAKLGTTYAGNLGIAGCFSFYPTKIMAIGEGGMITTNDHNIDYRAKILRNHGTLRGGEIITGLDYGVYAAGVSQNFRLSEISAILGLSQLNHLWEFVEQRNWIASQYKERLQDIKGISFIQEYKDSRSSYWNFYLVLDKNIDRETFAKSLLYDYGIQTANAYDPPCHKQKIYVDYIGENEFPVADDILKRHISLPMYFELNDNDIQYITNAIKRII